ncbi:hypothetical protein J6590_071288 [Homalodisca vitripennis]|nr:hypothetical protein J6590_071288 [Homalodisca vitripennis]
MKKVNKLLNYQLTLECSIGAERRYGLILAPTHAAFTAARAWTVETVQFYASVRPISGRMDTKQKRAVGASEPDLSWRSSGQNKQPVIEPCFLSGAKLRRFCSLALACVN